MASINDTFKVVFGDEWMAFYRNGELVAEGVHLTFGDVLEGAKLSCELQDADLEWAHNRTGYPQKLSEVPFDSPEVM